MATCGEGLHEQEAGDHKRGGPAEKCHKACKTDASKVTRHRKPRTGEAQNNYKANHVRDENG